MGNDYKPLSTISELPVATKSDAPPEPPTKPVSGPVYETKPSGEFFCKVPGCSKKDRPFHGKHAIAIHLTRMHGLTLEGKAHNRPFQQPAAPRPAPLPDVDVRGIIVGAELALIHQAIKILQTAKDNLTGKLSEMETLKAKNAKLDAIIGGLRQL